MEGFFLKACEVDASVISFAISKYGRNLDDFPFDYGIEIIRAGIEEEKNQRLWQLYLSVYPLMNEETFKSFDDFIKYQKEPPKAVHSKDQILGNVQNILHRSFKKGVIE